MHRAQELSGTEWRRGDTSVDEIGDAGLSGSRHSRRQHQMSSRRGAHGSTAAMQSASKQRGPDLLRIKTGRQQKPSST
jgi:hypothetical protein